MNTWVPLWTSTVQSTLWEEPPHVRVMFLTMLLVRDPDHVVRMPFRRLVKCANLDPDPERSIELAADAVKILSNPDARSIDQQEYEGRRIDPHPEGWLILNGEKYQEEMVKLTARIRKTQKQRERRERERATAEGAYCKAEKNGDQRAGDAALEGERGL